MARSYVKVPECILGSSWRMLLMIINAIYNAGICWHLYQERFAQDMAKAKAETPGANSLQSMPATLPLFRFALAQGAWHDWTSREIIPPSYEQRQFTTSNGKSIASQLIACGLTSWLNLILRFDHFCMLYPPKTNHM